MTGWHRRRTRPSAHNYLDFIRKTLVLDGRAHRLIVSVPAMFWFEVDRIRAKEGSLAARHRDLPGDEYRRVVIIAVSLFLEVKTADQIREGVVIHVL